MKKWLKIILIALGVILFLVFLATLLVSPVAKSYVNNHGKDLIGRNIHVERLKINVYTGHVNIGDLAVYEDDDSTVFFSFDTLDVSIKLGKLLSQKVHVKHITLASPKVRVIQNGDRFNFSSIIDFFATDEAEPETDTTPSEWVLAFYNIRLSDGEVYYADRKLKTDWDLKHLNIKIPGVYFDGSKNTEAGVALQLADGGTLRTTAAMDLNSNDFAVNVQLERFALSNVKAYLTDVMQVSKLGGLLDATVNVEGNLSKILNMNINGKVGLYSLDIKDNTGDDVLSVGRVWVDVNRINLAENLYDITNVTIEGLSTHFDLNRNGTNFDRLFASQPQSAEAVTVTESESVDTATVEEAPVASGTSTPMKLRVGSFALNDASFTFNDNTLPDPFSFPIKRLNVKADNLSLSGENNAKIFAQLPGGGMALINWKGNLGDWKSYQTLSLNIKNLHLKDMSPYSVAYLGHPFTNGTFSFTSENKIVNSMLNGNNKLDLYNPTVGKKRKDVDAEVNIPLRAALYVLKDKDNKVEFEVPVKGNIDSPEFSYMKIVWKTLGNLLVKVATSPIRMISSAVGGENGIDFITVDPLQIDFTSEQYDLLSKIAEVTSFDSAILITMTPNVDMHNAARAQSLYNLKKEYYFVLNPDKATAPRLEMIDFTNINAISYKDVGFVEYLRKQGYTDSNRPSEKEVNQIAERLYPVEQSRNEVLAVYEMRKRYLMHFFVDQMNVNSGQIVIGTLVEDAKVNGYELSSELREEE